MKYAIQMVRNQEIITLIKVGLVWCDPSGALEIYDEHNQMIGAFAHGEWVRVMVDEGVSE